MSNLSLNRRSVLAGVGAAATSALAGYRAALPQSEASPKPPGQSPGTSPNETADGSVYTEVYEDAGSSVVLVETGRGAGSGFQYDEDHVVTNAHVVGRANVVQLRYADGEWREGTVQGTDFHSDLAVIEVGTRPDGVDPLTLTDDTPAIGQEVVAIGNPYDLDGTVTVGIVSGTDRLIPSPGGFRIPDAIQTDAAVNPGNSGGPLMSLDGDVLAVINSGGGDNIGFGISAALTRRVVPQLIETGSYEHAYMGVTLQDVTPPVADANDLTEARGQLVVDTAPGGPADGVLEGSDIERANGGRVPVGGDVLLSVGGATVETQEDLASYLALQTRPGDTVEATVIREGTEERVELTLEARPDDSVSPVR